MGVMLSFQLSLFSCHAVILLQTMLGVSMVMLSTVVFSCKQRTAYEVRISDWSSDVCSSDLAHDDAVLRGQSLANDAQPADDGTKRDRPRLPDQIGRASCRERVCQSV